MALHRGLIVAGIVCGWIAACAGTGGGGGTNTNWVSCDTVGDCSPGELCIAKRCEPGDTTDDAGRDARMTSEMTADAPSPAPTFLMSPLPRGIAADSGAGAYSEVLTGNTEFALDLYQRLRNANDNLFFSPFSISTAMAMAWAGAKGQTESEIATVFHFPEPQAETHAALNALFQRISVDGTTLVLHSANALWVAPDISPLTPYLDLLAVDYGSGVGVVDFGRPDVAAATIDSWVSGETRGTIPNLLTPEDLSDAPNAVLTNAVYFAGKWQSLFATSNTIPQPFNLLDQTKVSVMMMEQIERLRYAAGSDYQAAAIPYRAEQGRSFELDVILPSGNFSTFEASFDEPKLDAILGALSPQQVNLEMPKFQMRSNVSLKQTLIAMGMPTAFGGSADFSGITTSTALQISAIIHQGFVSIDESGTEASGATAIILGDGSIEADSHVPPELRLNRPFLVLIRHVESGTVVFLGRVMNPAG